MASADFERHGVVKDEATGDNYIPATQRADGTWRKARRVKDGYIPQEEMPTYENRGVQWLKSKPDLPPGMNPEDADKFKVGQSNDVTSNMSKSAKKNAKRKEKKKSEQPKAAFVVDDDVSDIISTFVKTDISNDVGVQLESKKTVEKSGAKPKITTTASAEDSATQDPNKRLKNLKKKMKQIRDLEAKIKSGDVKNPEKEQLEKISKKPEILEEIEKLQLELTD